MSDLTELFGTGNNAYFSNGPITRLSFLRTNHELLDAASTHLSTKYLTFDSLNPLSKDGQFVYLGYEDVQTLIGRPYEKTEEELSNNFSPSISPPALTFLGLGLEQNSNAVQLEKYSGTAYFALDVSNRDAFKKTQTDLGYVYKDNRIDLTLSQAASAILSHSRSLLDWNK